MTQAASQTIDFERMEGRIRAGRGLAFLRLLRPVNMLMAGAGVLVGGILVEGSRVFAAGSLDSLLLAVLSVIGIAAGGNSLNDVADVEIDRVNRPDRPVASGRVSRNAATTLWAAMTFLGLASAALISVSHILVAIAAAVLLALYNFRYKRVPLAGNLVVSLLVSAVLVYGAMAVGEAGAAYVAAAFAFLVTLAREIVKDLEDVHGDREAGARTLPVTLGVNATRGIAGAVMLTTILATPLPFLFANYSGLYLAIVLITAVCLVAALFEVWSSPGSMRRVSTQLKLAMLFGLVALSFANALD